MKARILRPLRTVAGALLMSLGLNSCSVLGGETIGLRAYYKGIYDVFNIALFDEQDKAWGFVQYDKRYDWEKRPLTFPVISGANYLPDNQKRLPDKVRLVWLSAPHDSEFSAEEKAKIATFPFPPERVLVPTKDMLEAFKFPNPSPPRLYGPFEFDIRSKIPPSVLRKVKGSWTHELGVTIEFTETYHKMNWSLSDRRPKTQGVRNNPICMGGELDITPGQKVLNWSVGTSDFSAPIWPNCDI